MKGCIFFKLGESQIMLHLTDQEINPDCVSLHVNTADVNELFRQEAGKQHAKRA